MKKRIVFFLIFILFSFLVYSQEKDEPYFSVEDIENYLKEIYELKEEDRHCYFANIFYRLGCYDKAKEDYLKALQIIEEKFKHRQIHINLLISLGDVCTRLGEYQEAEEFLQHAKEICNAENIEESNLMYNLGYLYSNLGNYIKAEEYFLKYEELTTKIHGTLGENDISYIIGLGNIYNNLNKPVEANKYLNKALDIYNSCQINSLDSIDLLLYIGNTYLRQKEYKKTEGAYLKALQIYRKKNLRNELYVVLHNNLGYLYYTQKFYSKAEKYYGHAMILGFEYNKFLGGLQENMGCLYCKTNSFDKAKECFIKSSNLAKQEYYSSLNYMTEYERERYWNKLKRSFDSTYPLFSYNCYFTNPSIAAFSYDNELFRKGLLLSSSHGIRLSILESKDSMLINQWNELVGAKQSIIRLENNYHQSKIIDNYREKADSLEKLMIKSSTAFRENQALWEITCNSVRKHLSSNEVAIEFFSVPLSKDFTMYCALLLRHDSKYPELIPLFEEKKVLEYTNQFINGEPATNLIYSYSENEGKIVGYGKQLSQLVWSKILPKIKKGKTIYFAPSGILHQLAIEYLPYDNQRIMTDAYSMIRLSSTREIVKKKSKSKYSSAIIYGGITYDTDTTSMHEESYIYKAENLLASRSIENDTLNRGTVKYLLSTKIETEYINALLTKNNISTKFYTTSKANEESFKSLSGKHINIIHIGTHGFAWVDSVAKKQDFFIQHMQMLGEKRLFDYSIDPLNRCGLLFSGANIALQGKSKDLPKGVQDGILTAKEISLLDLRDAELVVLSACETAKGDITSEGVFGLQRAFKMAGVKTIIMSLWKVNDQATQLLMTEFYNNWIEKNQSKREAFRNAQNVVRSQYKDPIYWAGFIMLD